MRVFLILMSAIFMVLGSAVSLADRIDIDFIHPVQKKSKPNKPTVVPTQAFSGWPLTVEFTMNDELGIASTQGDTPPYFPIRGSRGFVLFDDPDGCQIFDWGTVPGAWPFPSGDTCYDDDSNLLITESDETYFEFTVDTDDVGVSDSRGNPARIAALVDATSGRPIIEPPGSTEPQAIGPFTSQTAMVDGSAVEIVDGFGYGADDDIPGMVLIARHGPGIVYENNGVAKFPLELRNLAGFTNAVSYELNNTKSKTTINAHMVVPTNLFAPVIVADESYDVPPDEINVYWRVDGAAVEQQAAGLVGDAVASTFKYGYSDYVGTQLFTISVMAVSGVAPDTVIDMNGDDEIDAWDLEQMGYTVLGEKKSIELRLFPGQPCHSGGGGENTVYADLDGNGAFTLGSVCPAGPGSVSKPPR